MSYNYTDCLEIACIDRFKCELNDLCVLEDIYTDLAEQSNVDYEKLARMNNLHTMDEYTYKTIRDYTFLPT